MPVTQEGGTPDDRPVAAGIRAAYDAIAGAYDTELGDELDGKPFDRGLLDGFVGLTGPGVIADVGCGPGHITRFLAARGAEVIGIDLSPGMIAVARQRSPELRFSVGSMLRLPAADGAWAGAIALYSIIHLTPGERLLACQELARTVRPDGWLLVAFHIDSSEFATGEVNHITTWFGEQVELDGFFLDPAEVTADVTAAGFTVMSTTIRRPLPTGEYPSRRCYLLAQRNTEAG
ncbi:MAG: class I SAM-dependent DNA methyltransferase [Streptosporangiaceae bacterium]